MEMIGPLMKRVDVSTSVLVVVGRWGVTLL